MACETVRREVWQKRLPLSKDVLDRYPWRPSPDACARTASRGPTDAEILRSEKKINTLSSILNPGGSLCAR